MGWQEQADTPEYNAEKTRTPFMIMQRPASKAKQVQPVELPCHSPICTKSTVKGITQRKSFLHVWGKKRRSWTNSGLSTQVLIILSLVRLRIPENQRGREVAISTQ